MPQIQPPPLRDMSKGLLAVAIDKAIEQEADPIYGSGNPYTIPTLKAIKASFTVDPNDPMGYIPIAPIGIVSRTTTGMPWYDNMLANPKYFREFKGVVGEVVDMAPSSFLEKLEHMFGRPVEGTSIPELVERYAKDISKKGTNYPMPVLDYAENLHEGRHRALAALKARIKTIPVFVVHKAMPPLRPTKPNKLLKVE
jgi:hypothetical protein